MQEIERRHLIPGEKKETPTKLHSFLEEQKFYCTTVQDITKKAIRTIVSVNLGSQMFVYML